MPPRLFHVSEQAGIRIFKPRPSPAPEDTGIGFDCVWAVDEAHLRNYLYPRDCPRITFAAGADSTAEDRERLLVGAACVAAIERDWLERLRSVRLSLYEFAPDGFECVDAGAGYWVRRGEVRPLSETTIGDVPAALQARGVELRLLADFWPLHDRVIASSLEFSIIRKRNAKPRA